MPLFQYSRSSCDGTINYFGERLLDICACFHLLILNGDEKRHFTYVSTHGCSVIDYCLVSDSFVDRVAIFAVCDRVESQHMPILFEITCAQGQSAAIVMHPIERVVWHRDKIQGFIENIQGDNFKDKIAHATEEIDKCIDKALGEITDSLMNAIACMRKKQTVGNTRQGGSIWFDRECREKKKSLRKRLARFRKASEQCDKLDYNCSRKECKQFIEAKKRDFRSSQVNSLLSTVNESQTFWKEIRKHRGRKVVTNDISGTDWRDHFEKVLNAGVNCAQLQQDGEATGDVFDEILDADITAEEVKQL